MTSGWRVQVLFAPEGTGGSGEAASGAGESAGRASSSGASAAPSAPAAGGTAAPPAASSSPSGASSPQAESPDPFAILGDDSDSMLEIPAAALDVGAPPPAKEVVVPPVQAAEATPEPPAQQPPVAPAAVVPPSPSTSAPAVGAVSPHLDTTDPAAMATLLRQNEKALVDAIASTQFALSPEDVEAYETDPSKFAATMAAKTFVRVQTAMMNQLAQMLPRAIERHLAVTNVAKKNEEEFFAAWPQLDAAKHRETVMTYAKLYRAQNPGKSKAEMIQALGPVVMMAAGVPLAAVAPVAPNGGPVAHSGNGVRPPQPSPFVPAVGGPAAPPQQAEQNPWDILGQD